MEETQEWFSVQEPTRNETLAVGTSSVVASQKRALNPGQKRKNIVIRNTSPNATDTITIALGFTQAVANNGIVLRQYDTWMDTTESGYECYQGVISAICATGTGQLSIFER